MKRRAFLAAAGGLAAWSCLPRVSWAGDLPRDWTITRILGFDLPSRRAKFVGKNARLDVHGDRGSDRVVRIVASSGREGFGTCRASETELAAWLGTNPFRAFDPTAPRRDGPLGAGTMPLWDLAGKALRMYASRA